MIRQVHNHTRSQVVGYLTDALAAIDEALVPDELRELAFAKAVDLLAAKQVNANDVAVALQRGIAPANGQRA